MICWGARILQRCLQRRAGLVGWPQPAGELIPALESRALLPFDSSCTAPNCYFINEQRTVMGKRHISSTEILHKFSTNSGQGPFTHYGPFYSLFYSLCSTAASRATTCPPSTPGWTTVHMSVLFTAEYSLCFLIFWYKYVSPFNYCNNNVIISQTYHTLHWSFVHDFFHYIGFLRGGESSSKEGKGREYILLNKIKAHTNLLLCTSISLYGINVPLYLYFC